MITCIHGIAAKRIIKYITLISVVFIDQSREWTEMKRTTSDL